MPGPQAPAGQPPTDDHAPALEFAGLYKRFGDNVAVDHIDLRVPPGSFFGRDVWSDPVAAKALIGDDAALRAVPAGIAWSALLGWRSGQVAQRRLERLAPEIFARVRTSAS
jgi:hypothetical protein